MEIYQLDPSMEKFIGGMPKAEVHIHLEGSIVPETVLQLAERNDLMSLLPAEDVDGLRKWYEFKDFEHFIVVYLVVQNLLRTGEDLELITYQAGADMHQQNIRYRELTFTPYTHTDYMDKGLTIEEMLEGMEAGRKKAFDEFGVEIRWVFDVPRNLSYPERDGNTYDPYPANRTLEYAILGKEKGVVGFGLGGYEVTAPPEPFEHSFVEAKANGLLSVPHAGETEGPESVWGAVRELKADRIGHGVRAIEDPELVAYLRDNRIPLEVNPTSNIRLHVYEEMNQHPFRQLDEAGVAVTVNSDDPPLFNTNLTNEFRVLAGVFGYGKEDLARIGRNAFEVCGADDGVKNRLLSEFDAWVEKEIGPA